MKKKKSVKKEEVKVKKKNGRPCKYEFAEDLEDKINEYFDYCDSQTVILENKIVYKAYTVSGLCLFLGITRETLGEYQKLEKFNYIVSLAKNRIENWIEEHSLAGDTNPAVSIFNLKNNFKWKDKTEVETNLSGELKIVWEE